MPSPLTSEGTNHGGFEPTDWTLLSLTSLIWGSSFLWIAIGLDAFHPGVIACGRMALGAAVLWSIPRARAPIPRTAWGPLAVIALGGNAFPAVFFALAQQRIESSVAGMINSVGPILTLVVSIAMLRKAPPRRSVIGLVVGLIGALLLAWPNVRGVDAEPLGVLLAFCAVIGYSISNNFMPPLAQTYGAAPVIARAMLASAIGLAPWGVWGVTSSSFAWDSLAALVILGVLGTGIARTMYATLTGRVGAPRSSLVGYLVPLVAVILGIVVRSESVGAIELVGTAFILAGAASIGKRSPRRPI